MIKTSFSATKVPLNKQPLAQLPRLGLQTQNGRISQAGFTLIELLTVVLIIGILTSIALPKYTRSIERSRATEGMAMIKTINDAVYAYAAQRNTCPTRFSQLVIGIPGQVVASSQIVGTNFSYEINKASSIIPGTDCKSAVASRIPGGSYKYTIWNPFTVGAGAGSRGLACYAPPDAGGNEKSVSLCKSLDLYSPTAP